LFSDRCRGFLARGIVVAGAAIAVFGLPSAGRAESVPCWKTLLNDWYDGRIDGAYEVRCYQSVVAHLPSGKKWSGDARAEVRRELLARLGSVRGLGRIGPSTLVPAAIARTHAKSGTDDALLRLTLAGCLVLLLLIWLVAWRRRRAKTGL
jgi:hypothetical protein